MNTGHTDCHDTWMFNRVTLGVLSGVLFLLVLLITYVMARDSSLGSVEPVSMSIVIEYYPAFDSDVVLADPPHAVFAGGAVVEVRAEGVLRFRDISDLSRMKERRLTSDEFARLRDSVRVAVQSLRSDQQRPGIVIDFSRVHVDLSYGRDHADLSYNMTIAQFLSATPLSANDPGAKMGSVELEQLRSEIVAVLRREKTHCEVEMSQEDHGAKPPTDAVEPPDRK
jgi:hypothetical protein